MIKENGWEEENQLESLGMKLKGNGHSSPNHATNTHSHAAHGILSASNNLEKRR